MLVKIRINRNFFRGQFNKLLVKLKLFLAHGSEISLLVFFTHEKVLRRHGKELC